MYYICLCITDHGKRYWVMDGDWRTVDNCVRHEGIDTEDIEEATECAEQNYDLNQWVQDGVIVTWDLTREPDRTYAD